VSKTTNFVSTSSTWHAFNNYPARI